MKNLSIAALLLAVMATTSWAQSAAEHEQHHPQQQDAAPAPTQPAPPGSQSGMGMMGGGGMMDMMGNLPMMNMMQMIGMMHTGAGMGGMAMIDHVEGQIAFLRTELKITDAQNAAWNTFADALRANAKSLAKVRASMMPQQGAASQTLVDRLSVQEKWLAACLEGTRAIKSALTNLIGSFSDEQKKAADELLAPHMGMMAMMAAMRPRQMGFGQMQPGMMMPGR
jgi:hypothetical protein